MKELIINDEGQKSTREILFTNRLNKSRDYYACFAGLFSVMSKYESGNCEKELESWIRIANISCEENNLPLPSGRKGNVLAVALEMRNYFSAIYMIENAERLGISLDRVSMDVDGSNVWGVKDTFELSQLGFVKSRSVDLVENGFDPIEESASLYGNDQIEAAKKLESLIQSLESSDETRRNYGK